MKGNKIMLTSETVAEIYGVERQTVLGWCRRGLLNANKIGSGARGIWLIPEDSLDNFTPPQTGRPRNRRASNNR